MSTYTSSSASFTLTARAPTEEEVLLNELRRSCSDIAAIPSSRILASIAAPEVSRARLPSTGTSSQPSIETPNLRRLEARIAAVDAAPGVREMLGVGSASMPRIEAFLAGARQAVTSGDHAGAETLAARADRLLRSRATAVSRRRARSERTAAATIVRDALREGGWAVREKRGRISTAIIAERGHVILAALAHDGGMVETDTAGFSAGSCRPVLRELERAMEKRGMVLDRVSSTDHGDSRGGPLIQRAARAAAGEGLEVGLVRQHEEPGSLRVAESTEQTTQQHAELQREAKGGLR